MTSEHVSDPSETPCKSCGVEGYEMSFIRDTREKLLARGVCFSCNFWEDIIEELPTFLVIDGAVYRSHPDNPELRKIAGGWGMGFGGVTRHIVKFDGEVIESKNLWCRGPVPDLFRDRVPDNARWATKDEQ